MPRKSTQDQLKALRSIAGKANRLRDRFSDLLELSEVKSSEELYTSVNLAFHAANSTSFTLFLNCIDLEETIANQKKDERARARKAKKSSPKKKRTR